MTQPMIDRLHEIFHKLSAEGANMSPPWFYRFTLERGSKYTRVVKESALKAGEFFQRAVFFFVNNETGDVLKAASWKTPAKGVRYNLLDDKSFQDMKDRAGIYNGFLYSRNL